MVDFEGSVMAFKNLARNYLRQLPRKVAVIFKESVITSKTWQGIISDSNRGFSGSDRGPSKTMMDQ